MQHGFSIPHDFFDVLRSEGDTDILPLDFMRDLLSEVDADDFNGFTAEVDGLKGAGVTPYHTQRSFSPISAAHAHVEIPSDGLDAIAVDRVGSINSGVDAVGVDLIGSNNSAASGGASDDVFDASGKKKRTRNTSQMEMNRVAQRQYRERKKGEQSGLQNAIDLLTAELSAMKAIEYRAKQLEMKNLALLTESTQQQLKIQDLEHTVAEKDWVIQNQRAAAREQAATLDKAQKMILDQYERLRLQEEIIASLKEKVRESVEAVWASMEHTDVTTVCRKMHEAVRAALMEAEDVDGLQETLSKLPDFVVVQVCKNVLHSCKDMWPQVSDYFAKACPGGLATCSASIGHLG